MNFWSVGRDSVITQLANLILQVCRPHPLRVAIDGVDAAGKTMLSDELAAPQTTPADAILLLDGIFLLRPELAGWWDFSIFVQASFATTLQRALVRDRNLIGSAEAVKEKYERRYIPGQQLYLSQAHPAQAADVVLVNDDPEHPILIIKNVL